jgi:IclR family transcriptional regulator, acetate operon repressor
MSAVQSVERAFSIIGCLASGTTGVSEIAERVDLPKSTVSRLLVTLVEIGVVEQTGPGGGYRLGPYLYELASNANPVPSLLSHARPHISELVGSVGESAGLAILDGHDVLYLDQVTALGNIQVRDWTNERVKAHVVSSGLVLLAFGAPETVDNLLAEPLPAMTSKSMTDPVLLRQRLAAVRSAGYAWVVDELSEGLSSVAAPVLDPTGRAVAAVHVHGPSFRFPGSNTALVNNRVRATADRIANALRLFPSLPLPTPSVPVPTAPVLPK